MTKIKVYSISKKYNKFFFYFNFHLYASMYCFVKYFCYLFICPFVSKKKKYIYIYRERERERERERDGFIKGSHVCVCVFCERDL